MSHFRYNPTCPSRLLCILAVALTLMLTSAAAPASIDELRSDTLAARGALLVSQRCHLDSAMRCLSLVVRRYYTDPGDKKQHMAAIKAMHALGTMYLIEMTDYGKAYEYLTTGLALAEEDSMCRELPWLYISMSGLWNCTVMVAGKGQEQHAEFMHRAWNAALRTRDWNALTVVAGNMAMAQEYQKPGEYDKELRAYERMRLPASVPHLAFTRSLIAAYRAFMAGHYAKASELFGQASHQAKITPDGWQQRFNTAIMQAVAICENGHALKAVDLLKRQLSIVVPANKMENQITLCRELAYCYEKAQMPDSARHYEYLYLKLCKQGEEQKIPDMGEKTLTHEIERINEELRQMSIRRQQRERQLMWVCSIGLLAIVIASAVIWNLRSQRRHLRQLYQQNMKSLKHHEAQAAPIKYRTSPMDIGMNAELYGQVLRVFEEDPEIYDPGFSMDRLAQKLGIRSNYISQAINNCAGMSFPQLLNDYRVREACKRYNDIETYGNLTVEAMANGVGMSRASFAQRFKEATGMTPAQYRKNAMKATS